MILIFCTYFCTNVIFAPCQTVQMKFSKINYAIVFNRKNRLNKDGKGLIQIRAYKNGKVKYFSTEVFIKPKYWDEKNKRVNSKHPNKLIINQQIADQINKMEVYENRMLNRDKYFPLERLVDYKTADKCYKSFLPFYKSELELSIIQPDSLKSQRTTFNKLKAFSPIIYFEDLTFDFVTRFNKFLHNQGLAKNTIQKHHKVVAKYIKLAIHKKYMKVDDNPYINFVNTGEEPERDFLNELELERLEKLTFLKREQHLERIRDFLLLCCYTGLRYSDVSKLKPSNIEKTKNGLILSYVAKKTGKVGRIPLHLLFKQESEVHTKPEQLINKLLGQHLEKYKDIDRAKDEPFFKLTNQYINRKLKFIARRIRTNKKLVTHIGRRTFATVLNSKGVSAKGIQKLMQHSTPTMTFIYVAMGDKMIEDELNKITW